MVYYVNSKINFSQRDVLTERTYVRLLLSWAEATFNKSYKPIYSIEIFEIYKVVRAKPTLYYLKDLLGEIIKGVVYRQEIVPVSLPEYFAVEKILKSKICPKTKQKLHLVKFLGYPMKFSIWIPKAQLRKTHDQQWLKIKKV